MNIEGKKELLGLYISDQEGAHHWLSVLTDLHNRGVQDVLIACVDGLKGFPETIESIYPKAEIQHCVIHQIRNSIKYVASKNQKAFIADLKCVYKAATLNAAEIALDELENELADSFELLSIPSHIYLSFQIMHLNHRIPIHSIQGRRFLKELCNENTVQSRSNFGDHVGT